MGLTLSFEDFARVLKIPKSILFGVYGIPESILIDKKHKIISKFIGPLNTKDYKDILQLLNEK